MSLTQIDNLWKEFYLERIVVLNKLRKVESFLLSKRHLTKSGDATGIWQIRIAVQHAVMQSAPEVRNCAFPNVSRVEVEKACCR